jgi:hypothetical protein
MIISPALNGSSGSLSFTLALAKFTLKKSKLRVKKKPITLILKMLVLKNLLPIKTPSFCDCKCREYIIEKKYLG